VLKFVYVDKMRISHPHQPPHFIDLNIGSVQKAKGRRDTWRSIRHGSLSCHCLRATDTQWDSAGGIVQATGTTGHF